MLEGLAETSEHLWEHGAQFKIEHNNPAEGCVTYSEKASLVVLDRGYQRNQRYWYQYVSEKSPSPVVQIESDTVVPVESAAEKEMYMAVHLRNRITPLIPKYIIELPQSEVNNTSSIVDHVEGEFTADN